ncbi:prenyltransferase/squalene oxidase repeat-containing protein [Zavarzinella formosa]|uniref:prenyltransferase/squalene oxidase repeat-containing protein n=1 Tax=Zavarzinella formosa TaxID=360055 RepID=UPI0002E434A7|nr:prenyltransferase/squalene oxidase repeat-containing protein [Zavarzinella formosa]
MRLFALAIAFCIPALGFAQGPKEREPFELAVDQGVEYLAKSQNGDGSWNSGRQFGGFGNNGGQRDPAVTALCVMAFLSSGHVPGEGRYGDAIERGIRFVASQQQRNGMFAASQFGMTQMYSHGICTLMVAEAVGLMPDRRMAESLRTQLVLAVRLIRSAQCVLAENTGGWRYTPDGRDADISVTGWQVMALRAARNVGCDVPAETVEKAVGYIKRCYDPQVGGYRYTRYSAVTVPCTGASILSLELCGKEYHASDESLRAAGYLLRKENILNQARPHFFYGIYYTSQAMFQIGDDPGKAGENKNPNNYWQIYRQVLHFLLLKQYAPKAGGFWQSASADDNMAGINYCTAMAILALTVEYRYLPIYQRGHESDEREDKR